MTIDQIIPNQSLSHTIEHEPPVPAAPLYWWTAAFLVSSFVGLTVAMLLFTPDVAAAAAERLHDALFYVERV